MEGKANFYKIWYYSMISKTSDKGGTEHLQVWSTDIPK